MASFLERCYPWAPVWVQNLGISLYGLLWRQERLGGEFASYVEQYRSRDRWSPDRMQAHVEAELRRILLQAFNGVPYYQQAWTAAGCTQQLLGQFTLQDLTQLPVTPKQALRAQPEAFVHREAARGQRLKCQMTSGSTGTPIVVYTEPDEHRKFIAAREVRSFGWAGTSIRFPRSMIGGRLVVPRALSQPPFHRYNLAERQLYLSAYHIAPAHVRDYVAALNWHRPRLLTGYAASHYLLGRFMLEQGLTLRYEPDALVLSSEKLTPEMKRVLRLAFRARAYEEYGAVENCALATECEAGNLHVHPDFGIVEIVNAEGQPVAPGEEGRLLCTSLIKETQPLIRYDIGDLGIWSNKRCPCGRDQLPVLKEVVGRLEDVVVGAEGRELVRFHGIFVGLPHVAEAQVIQETLDAITVKVVPTAGYGEEDESLIRQRLLERLGPISVQIQQVREIPRNERGKFRAVISRLPATERRRLELSVGSGAKAQAEAVL